MLKKNTLILTVLFASIPLIAMEELKLQMKTDEFKLPEKWCIALQACMGMDLDTRPTRCPLAARSTKAPEDVLAAIEELRVSISQNCQQHEDALDVLGEDGIIKKVRWDSATLAELPDRHSRFNSPLLLFLQVHHAALFYIGQLLESKAKVDPLTLGLTLDIILDNLEQIYDLDYQRRYLQPIRSAFHNGKSDEMPKLIAMASIKRLPYLIKGVEKPLGLSKKKLVGFFAPDEVFDLAEASEEKAQQAEAKRRIEKYQTNALLAFFSSVLLSTASQAFVVNYRDEIFGDHADLKTLTLFTSIYLPLLAACWFAKTAIEDFGIQECFKPLL